MATPQASQSAKPLFASDADALAAATKAYAAYLKVSDLISQEGGVNPDRLAPLVTSKWLQHEQNASKKLADSKRHQSGSTTFDQARLQSYSSGEGGAVNIGVYVCLDLSGARLLDENDVDVTPTGVQASFPFVVTFVGMDHGSADLLLDGSETWGGKNFC